MTRLAEQLILAAGSRVLIDGSVAILNSLQLLFADNQNAHGWSSRKEDENGKKQADKRQPGSREEKPAFQPDS